MVEPRRALRKALAKAAGEGYAGASEFGADLWACGRVRAASGDASSDANSLPTPFPASARTTRLGAPRRLRA